MPTITIRDPESNPPPGDPYLNPLRVSGVFTLDGQGGYQITGEATYTYEDDTYTVEGNQLVTNRVFWELEFTIPHGGVECQVTAHIDEGGNTDEDSRDDLHMALQPLASAYYNTQGAVVPASAVSVEFIGTRDPNVILAVGRSRMPVGTTLHCLCLRYDTRTEQFYTVCLLAPTLLAGGWWTAILPVTQDDRNDGRLLEVLLVTPDGRVLRRASRVVPAS
jgi:hypothetical protein